MSRCPSNILVPGHAKTSKLSVSRLYYLSYENEEGAASVSELWEPTSRRARESANQIPATLGARHLARGPRLLHLLRNDDVWKLRTRDWPAVRASAHRHAQRSLRARERESRCVTVAACGV